MSDRRLVFFDHARNLGSCLWQTFLVVETVQSMFCEGWQYHHSSIHCLQNRAGRRDDSNCVQEDKHILPIRR